MLNCCLLQYLLILQNNPITRPAKAQKIYPVIPEVIDHRPKKERHAHAPSRDILANIVRQDLKRKRKPEVHEKETAKKQRVQKPKPPAKKESNSDRLKRMQRNFNRFQRKSWLFWYWICNSYCSHLFISPNFSPQKNCHLLCTFRNEMIFFLMLVIVRDFNAMRKRLFFYQLPSFTHAQNDILQCS